MEYITNFFKPINNFYKTKKNIINLILKNIII